MNTSSSATSSKAQMYTKYNKKTLQKKLENKLAFQNEFGLLTDKRAPLCCITVPLSQKNAGELLEELIPGLLSLNMQCVIRGCGTEKYQDFFNNLADKNPHQIKIIPDSKENLDKIYAASDMGLVIKNTEDFRSELTAYLEHGVVPICLHNSAQDHTITDYNPAMEQGAGFIFEKENMWSVFAALVRAQETYRLPYDWRNIQKAGMKLVE